MRLEQLARIYPMREGNRKLRGTDMFGDSAAIGEKDEIALRAFNFSERLLCFRMCHRSIGENTVDAVQEKN